MKRLLAAAAVLASPACVLEPPVEEGPGGVPVLGGGSTSLKDVVVDVIGTAEDGLNGPRALAFNPDREGELWVVSRHDDSTVTYSEVGTPNQRAKHLVDPFAMHFMEEVSSVAFSTGMKFGTCQESRNTYNDQAPHNDFMGPSLWSADPAVYAQSNPVAVEEQGFDLGSHLDMLHESPLCMGIAWQEANIYWTFDGLTGSLSRYDFAEDHGPGFDDHSDGVIDRFVEADVKRVEDVPSHLVFDHDTGLLYVADTGNSRVAVLDPAQGQEGLSLPVMEPGTKLTEYTHVRAEDVVPPGESSLERPSGIALHDGMIFVSDNATGRIHAFSMEGEWIDYLDTELEAGALMGIAFDAEGRLYAVDYTGDRVLRYSPRAE